METPDTATTQKAYGIAAANFLTFQNPVFEAHPHLAFVEYEAAMEEGRLANGLCPWGPYKHMGDLRDVMRRLADHCARLLTDTREGGDISVFENVPFDTSQNTLMRFDVAVRRVTASKYLTLQVLATSTDDAELLAGSLARDCEFSAESSDYEIIAVQDGASLVPTGALLPWRDPDSGEVISIIYQNTNGAVINCTTQSGGEVQIFAGELV